MIIGIGFFAMDSLDDPAEYPYIDLTIKSIDVKKIVNWYHSSEKNEIMKLIRTIKNNGG